MKRPDAPLETLITIEGGGTPSKARPEFYKGAIPWVTPKDMKSWEIFDSQDHITAEAIEESTTKLIPVGAVLVVIRSGVLKHSLPIAINRVPVTLNQDMKALRCGKDLHPEYLARVLQAFSPRLLQTVRGTTADNISTDVLRRLEIPVPPLHEQRRIAEILDKADALRAKRRKTIGMLDELASSTFTEMFGDPVANPKNWPNTGLGDHLSFQLYGPRFYNEAYTPHGVRIVRITDLDAQGRLNFCEMPRLDVCKEDLEKYALQPGDIIFARTGATVGKVALIREGDPPCIAGAYFITMRFGNSIHPEYARAALVSPAVQAIVWKRSQQTAQQNFSGPGLRSLPMPVPPLELQVKFAEIVRSIESQKQKLVVSLNYFDQLFGSLQARAFEGGRPHELMASCLFAPARLGGLAESLQ